MSIRLEKCGDHQTRIVVKVDRVRSTRARFIRAVQHHGAEHVMWCLSLTTEEMWDLHCDDLETYAHVVEVRRMVNEQLAKNLKHVVSFD